MMRYRNAIFALAYSKEKDKIEYLILKRKLHWKGWEFPKGGVDSSETKEKAVRRELKEETGLKALKIKKFNISGKYKYEKEYPDRKGFIGQSYSLYAVEVKREKGKIKLDRKEHSEAAWVDFKKAMKKLRWANQKKCLKIVNKWLKHGT